MFFGVQTDRISVYPPPPPNGAENGFFSPREPGRALQVPTPPYFGGAEFNYEPNSHQPSAGTSQNVFFRVQTDRISVYPPPPPLQRCGKWVFSPREPGRALQVPPPRPILGVLNSIMRLILINQALGHLKMFFFKVQTNRISVYPPRPPNGAENGFFHLVSPAGHFRYPTPLFWRCWIQL